MIGLDQESRCHGRGLEQRFWQRRPAGLLEKQDQVELTHTQPTVGFGHRETDDPELGERAPQNRRVGRTGIPSCAHDLGRALLGEELPDRITEQQLIVGEREAHAYFLGSPSTRSATTLRWISLVPA